MLDGLERNIVWQAKPAQTWLNLADFKTWGRITTTAEDAMLTALLQGAADHIEFLMGKSVMATEFIINFSRFPGVAYGRQRKLFLGVAPVQSISSMTYTQLNTEATITLVQGTDFYASLNNSNPYVVDCWNTGSGCWPDFDLAWHQPDVIQVSGTAGIIGYQSFTDAPVNVKNAAYMLTLLRYQNREGSNPNIEYKDLPGYAGVMGLLGPYMRGVL